MEQLTQADLKRFKFGHIYFFFNQAELGLAPQAQLKCYLQLYFSCALYTFLANIGNCGGFTILLGILGFMVCLCQKCNLKASSSIGRSRGNMALLNILFVIGAGLSGYGAIVTYNSMGYFKYYYLYGGSNKSATLRFLLG